MTTRGDFFAVFITYTTYGIFGMLRMFLSYFRLLWKLFWIVHDKIKRGCINTRAFATTTSTYYIDYVSDKLVTLFNGIKVSICLRHFTIKPFLSK